MSLPPEEGRDPVAITERAFELGINYFDTAPGYGNGQSETNVATVVSSHRDQIFLATKVHFPRTYDNALRSIEGSLNRLQTDHVDLLQVHSIGEEVYRPGR